MVITRGRDGATLVGKSGLQNVLPFEVQPVDTTGAGDAFVAAFAVAMAEGKTLLDAVHFGNAVGALTTTRPGAQPSLPARAEVEHLLAT